MTDRCAAASLRWADGNAARFKTSKTEAVLFSRKWKHWQAGGEKTIRVGPTQKRGNVLARNPASGPTVDPGWSGSTVGSEKTHHNRPNHVLCNCLLLNVRYFSHLLRHR